MKKLFTFLSIGFITVCASQTSKYLDKNNVKAKILVCNDKFWNKDGNGNPSYEVPVGSGRHAMFANSLWIGGLDAGNQLHVAANTYKQSGTDFWTGPLDTTNITVKTPSNLALYNRLWKIDCADINDFATAFSNGSVAANTYTVPNDILNYPAIGVGNFQKQLAPFFDANGNGLYDPLLGGDYPIIKGQQQILSIFNDQNGLHTESQGLPMGLEIHERSYAYSDPLVADSMQAINFSTFYHYTIYNRSSTNYHNVYVSDWNDVDLGYYLDDYIGCDTLNNFAFCYNGNPFDPSALGTLGYGSRPPVSTHALLPIDCSNDGIDNDGDLVVDEPGETFLMNKVTYYNNNFNTFPVATTNPNSAVHYYNFMSALWKDGSPFTYGGNAYGGTRPVNYVYPSDPNVSVGWNETTAANQPGDRRIIMSSGPFNLPAGSKIEWGYAIVFSQDTNANTNTISQYGRVQRDVRIARQYDAARQFAQCSPPILNTTGIQTTSLNTWETMIYPNPTESELIVDINRNERNWRIEIQSLDGKMIQEQGMSTASRTSLSLTELPPGLYFLKVSTEQESKTYKILKK